MVEFLQRQLGLGPEGSDESRSSLHGLEPAAGVVAELAQVGGTEIAELAMLQMAPDVLDRIELWCIGGQDFELDRAIETVDVLAHESAFVHGQAVPDDQQFAFDLSLERLEKLNHLRSLDGAREQAEVKTGERDAGNHRQLLPGKAVLQDRCLPDRRPGANPGRSLRQAGLVNENDYASLTLGVFLTPASA